MLALVGSAFIITNEAYFPSFMLLRDTYDALAISLDFYPVRCACFARCSGFETYACPLITVKPESHDSLLGAGYTAISKSDVRS